ncbi:MAG: DUF58 domain-containing protein, partial [Sciscionella sp.]|nr:DUF58 domain-containing protein [Sciscionella sp.]
MRRASAGLTTRGRCMIAAGIAAGVCAVILNERDLLRVAVFVVALPILAAALTVRLRVALRAQRSLHPQRVPVDAGAEACVRVHSTGRLPSGGLLLEDDVSAALGNRPRFVVERLPRRSGIELRYSLRPQQRGVHAIGPLLVRVTDPFGLAEYDRVLAGQSRLLVLPRVHRLAGLPRGSGVGAGDDGSVRLHSGQGEDDAVVRQYRYGDDLRKVHWKSTAHRDELMVRVEERPWRGGTTVLLDHRAGAHVGDGKDASIEWAIEFVASVCTHLQHLEHKVRLVTEDGRPLAGAAGVDELVSAGYAGSIGDIGDGTMLDALAVLQPSHREEFVSAGDPGAGQELIAVLGALDASTAAELAKYRNRGLRSIAVLLDTASWSRSDGIGDRQGHDPAAAHSAGGDTTDPS